MNLRHCITGLALLALSALSPARAQLLVEPTVSASAGMFHYSYAFQNNTSADISVITLAGLFPSANAVQNLFAPSGFDAFFDPGVALLSFFEDTQTFAIGTSSGPFTFDSPYAPGGGSFEAVDINGMLSSGSALVPMSAVPEPSTYAILGSVVLIGLVLHRKVRRSSSSPCN